MLKDRVIFGKDQVQSEIDDLIELLVEASEGRSRYEILSLMRDSHDDRNLDAITIFFREKE